jgi:hypothetical protein
MEAPQPRLPDILGGIDPFVKEDDWLLDADDIPLPSGLCYRIVQESLGPGPAPGKRVWDNLDREGRVLVRRAADDREPNAQERGGLVKGLNAVLQEAGFYDEASFRDAPRPLKVQLAAAHWLRGGGGQADAPPRAQVIKFNRRLLEAAYPEQVIPRSERRLDDKGRAEWLRRARRDLADARRKFGK